MQKYMHFAYKNMLIFNNHQVLLSSRLNKHFIIEKPKDIIRNIIAEAYAFCIKNMLMFNNHYLLLSSRLNKHFIIKNTWCEKKNSSIACAWMTVEKTNIYKTITGTFNSKRSVWPWGLKIMEILVMEFFFSFEFQLIFMKFWSRNNLE